jgi:hypothetical protein
VKGLQGIEATRHLLGVQPGLGKTSAVLLETVALLALTPTM